jgi:isocitrate/isopropylmalate dehydrogenase
MPAFRIAMLPGEVVVPPGLARLSPLRAERVAGTDLLVVRELNGDVYTSLPRGQRSAPDGESFDVILTGNLFGDLLSDAASALTGSIGLSASAMLGKGAKGMFEAGHGTALDIAGQDIANPIACIRAFGLLLRHSARRSDLSAAIGGCDTLGVRPRLPNRGHPMQQHPAGWSGAHG